MCWRRLGEPHSIACSHLPEGIALGRGQIEVRFTSVPEALQKLFTLAQGITNDYDRFAAMVSTDPHRAVGKSTP